MIKEIVLTILVVFGFFDILLIVGCLRLEKKQDEMKPMSDGKRSERMEDLIKREDAIDAIEGTDWYHQNRNKDMVSGANSDEHQAWYKADDVYKALEEVPSADRPSGEWIDKGDYAECSNCGAHSGTQFDGVESIPLKTQFCPYCGSKMRGEHND